MEGYQPWKWSRWSSTTKSEGTTWKSQSWTSKDGVQFPIHIDVPVAQNSTNFVSRVTAIWNKLWKILLVGTMSFLIFKWWTQTKCWILLWAISCEHQTGIKEWSDGTQTMMIHQHDTLQPASRIEQKLPWSCGGVDNHQQSVWMECKTTTQIMTLDIWRWKCNINSCR